MSEDVRSGLIRRFLIEGDETERPGRVKLGEVGIDLGGGIEIIASRGDLLKFAREIYARFSGRAFPQGITNPTILITGDPVDGFEFYGPADGTDPDGYLFARQRRLEDDSEDCWLARLRPLADLGPVDGDDDVPVRAGTATDLLDEFEDVPLSRLAEMVHAAATGTASAVNAMGRDRQITYLVETGGYEAARDVLSKLAA